MELWKMIATAVPAYLLGSVSVAILVCKQLYGKDVRQCGSGNAGATNVARVFGMKAGVLTFVGDFIKTALALLLGWWLLGDTGRCIAACACLVGHCYPVFFGFRGGKGVTVSAAIALLLDFRLFLILVAVFFIVYYFARTVSVCSLSAAIAFPFGLWVLGDTTLPMLITGIFVAVLVCFMHRGNIKRILSGAEPKFQAKK